MRIRLTNKDNNNSVNVDLLQPYIRVIFVTSPGLNVLRWPITSWNSGSRVTIVGSPFLLKYFFLHFYRKFGDNFPYFIIYSRIKKKWALTIHNGETKLPERVIPIVHYWVIIVRNSAWICDVIVVFCEISNSGLKKQYLQNIRIFLLL